MLLTSCQSKPPLRWAAYYGNVFPDSAFAPYDIIVFDRASHPPLAPLKEEGKILLGYVSLGEAETSRSDYQNIVNDDLVLDTGPHWTGNPIIDTRKSKWASYMLNTLIPSITSQGFDGIMLDTTDSLIAVETMNPRYAGLTQAAALIIKDIHARYPHLVIMLNRGFEILPQVEHDINYVLAESIYTYWTGTGKPKMVDPHVYQSIAESLKKVQSESPQLKVVTVDYWPPDDRKTIRRIYAAQRAEEFIPYVTTPDLQALTPEPQ
ncbi:MAG: endo alpha-1,4 polygalactosaminidase [Pseudomonadota bacterium]|nr:endo alpha-1,4 polygalactosaminidase [Pseudomonadota bacterium]